MSWYETVAGVILPAPVEGNEPARANGWRCRRRMPAQADSSNPYGRADGTSLLRVSCEGISWVVALGRYQGGLLRSTMVSEGSM